MRPDPLLPNPPDLDKALAGRTCPEPSAGLRKRILASLTAERPSAIHRPRRHLWYVLWQAAAAVVLALNLAMSAANSLRYQSLNSRVAQPGHTAPTDDDRFPAFATSALDQLTPAPDVSPVCRRFLEQQEY